jgi:hypothetical protein
MSTPTSKPWTVLVYFAGDNNLTTEMARALDEIVRSGHNPDINIYVYFDSLSRDVPTMYCDLNDPKGSKRRIATFFRSHKIRPKLIERERLFNENSASMNNILNFVHWCVERDRSGPKPERDYALIFSGHSFGFLDWGLFKDTNSDYYMTLSKLRWLFERLTYPKHTLETIAKNQQDREREEAARQNRPYKPWSPRKVRERTTPVIGKPISLLGFDSCEMGTLEIASQFHSLSETLVASAGSVPNAGWNFAQILSEWIHELGFLGELSPKRLAIRFVEGFIKQQSAFALADKSVDMAAWDLSKLPDLEKKFAVLCENLSRCFDGAGFTAHQQMRRILAQVHVDCQTYLLEQHIDLGDFCKLLVREIKMLEKEFPPWKIEEIVDVRKSCEEVIIEIGKCILLCGFSGKERQYTSGIALFFPWSLESYWEASKDYEKLYFIKNHVTGRRWKKFLKSYLKRVSRRPAIDLSAVDEQGRVIITQNMRSVVYSSYRFEDVDISGFPITAEFFESNEVGEGKRPPDGDKRPPDGDKRPPDGDKLLNNLSVFLSYFMRMKNIHARWNQTGFSANTDLVEFVAAAKSSGTVADDDIKKIEVTIPRGRTVDRR